MAVAGMISLFSSSALFLHISYRLLVLMWSRKASSQGSQAGMDLSLGLSESHYLQTKKGMRNHQQSSSDNQESRNHGNRIAHATNQRSPNPLLILIYNLILGDAGFSGAYVANIIWLRQDAIVVGSVTCNAQGWLVSFGCTISSAFLLTLATYTYLIVIRGWRPSLTFTVLLSGFIWAASIILICLGPIFSGEEHYFSRQQFWVCTPHSTYRSLCALSYQFLGAFTVG